MFLLPFSHDVKVQQAQREKMVVMSFLAGMPLEFETAKSHILSSSKISYLQDVFTRVLRIESTVSVPLSLQPNSALVSRSNVNKPRRPYNRNNNRGGGSSNSDNRSQNSRGVVCYYCHELGHTKCTYGKLQNQSQKPHLAHVAATKALPSSSSKKTIMVFAEEFAKFSNYQDALGSSSHTITAIAESGKPNTRLISHPPNGSLILVLQIIC